MEGRRQLGAWDRGGRDCIGGGTVPDKGNLYGARRCAFSTHTELEA